MSIQYAKKSVTDWLTEREGHLSLHIHGHFRQFLWKKNYLRNCFGKTLEGGEVTIFNRDLDHSNLVYQEFDCKTLYYCHRLYLHPIFLILESVLEEFRKFSYATLGLDGLHFFTASNRSGELFLKVCNAEIELFTHREHLELAENFIRGGVSSVFAKRISEANNKFLPTHNPAAKQTFGFFIDANYLDGGILENLIYLWKTLFWKQKAKLTCIKF